MPEPRLEAAPEKWKRTLKDLYAGAAGGIAQVLLGKASAIVPLLRMEDHFYRRRLFLPQPYAAMIVLCYLPVMMFFCSRGAVTGSLSKAAVSMLPLGVFQLL